MFGNSVKECELFRKKIFDLCKRVESDNNDYHINEILNMDYLTYFGKGNEENNNRFVWSLYWYLDTHLYWGRLERYGYINSEALNEAIDNHEQDWFARGND